MSVAPNPEVGLITVETADETLVPSGPGWAFHSDVIEAPAEARLVALNGCGAQASTLPLALGVQFHPEVRPSVLEEWLDRLPDMVAASPLAPVELVESADRREDDARAAAAAPVDCFLAQFLGTHPAGSAGG